jgi:hypothetical protein
MSRTLSATISSAISSQATRPIYLIEMGFSTTVRAATWDQDITWGGYSWVASGITLSNLSANGTRMEFPTGTSDPWLALALNEGTRNTTVSIYEHHYDATASPQTDAVLVFTGIMDEVTLSDRMSVSVIESSASKAFPAQSVDLPTFSYLMTPGDQIVWGNQTITVN